MKNKKKVLLIRPYNKLIVSEHVTPPTGLICIGSVLKRDNFEVKIIDAMAEENYKKKILQEAKDSFIVGIGVWTAEVESAYEITKLIKNHFDVPVVWGSWHPTLFPEQTVRSEVVDYVIINEGEYSFADLAKAIAKNKLKEIRKIPGLFYKERGNVKFNPREGYIDLNTLPEIDYSLVDVERYIPEKISNEERRALPYESSRGCPHRCAFCINRVAENRVYRTKSVQKTLDELEKIVKKYNLNYVVFQEDNFFVDKERVKEICEGIIKRNLKIEWFAECRADYFKEGHISMDLLRLAKKAGLHTLTIGAESGSELSLMKIKKDITIKQTINSARICNELGIIPSFSFIIGFPHEKLSEVYKTVDLIIKLFDICPGMEAGVGTFRPYPRCEIVDDLVKRGLFKEPKTLEEWLRGDYVRLYTENYYQASWQESPKLLNNICYYFSIFSAYPEKDIKNFIKGKRIKYFPYIFFRFIAKKRIQYKLFGLNIDRFFFENMKKVYSLIKRKETIKI